MKHPVPITITGIVKQVRRRTNHIGMQLLTVQVETQSGWVSTLKFQQLVNPDLSDGQDVTIVGFPRTGKGTNLAAVNVTINLRLGINDPSLSAALITPTFGH